MSSNADVAGRYFDDILSHGRLDLIEDVFAPDYADHTARPSRPPGRASEP